MTPNRLEFDAPPHVREAIAGMGRTEDLALSPNSKRLAIAEYALNRVLVLNVAKEDRLTTARLALTDFLELSSPQLDEPHGLNFLDEDTIIVANRGGAALVFRLPPSGSSERHHVSSPLTTIRRSWYRPLVSPGSVAVSSVGPELTEVLICNNYSHIVTRHLLDRRRGYRVKASRDLLRKGLAVPDGVAVSRDGRWIAISNHNTHTVLMFENTLGANPKTEPVGTLHDVDCPHGLRFTDDGLALFVASAAAPFVHVFARQASVEPPGLDGWRGDHHPIVSLRVMDDETFSKGRYNSQEGGPKGLEVSAELNLMVTTSEHQPLAFYDLDPLLRAVAASRHSLAG